MTPTQEKKLNEVHDAIIGNPAFGQKGIVPRLNELEDYQQKDKLYKAKVAGGLFIGVPLLDAFLHWIGKHI